jgi:hypothetical protein
VRTDEDHVFSERWELGERLDAYSYRVDAVVGGRFGSQIRVDERRSAGSATVERITTGAVGSNERPRPRRESFRVGDDFVCPPAEDLVASHVARQTDGRAALVSASTVFGFSTHSRLLMPLAADEQGLARVLVLRDFYPVGDLLAFDSNGQLDSQHNAVIRLQRAPIDQVVREVPSLLRHLPEP